MAGKVYLARASRLAEVESPDDQAGPASQLISEEATRTSGLDRSGKNKHAPRASDAARGSEEERRRAARCMLGGLEGRRRRKERRGEEEGDGGEVGETKQQPKNGAPSRESPAPSLFTRQRRRPAGGSCESGPPGFLARARQLAADSHPARPRLRQPARRAAQGTPEACLHGRVGGGHGDGARDEPAGPSRVGIAPVPGLTP